MSLRDWWERIPVEVIVAVVGGAASAQCAAAAPIAAGYRVSLRLVTWSGSMQMGSWSELLHGQTRLFAEGVWLLAHWQQGPKMLLCGWVFPSVDAARALMILPRWLDALAAYKMKERLVKAGTGQSYGVAEQGFLAEVLSELKDDIPSGLLDDESTLHELLTAVLSMDSDTPQEAALSLREPLKPPHQDAIPQYRPEIHRCKETHDFYAATWGKAGDVTTFVLMTDAVAADINA